MPLRHVLRPLIVLGVLRAALSLSAGETPAFRNPDLDWDTRARDLVSRMTVEEKISQLMMATPAIPRLGIPAYDWWNEALHGVARNGYATVFPQAIGLAATWDTDLHFQIAQTISTEARAKNNELLRKTGGASARFEGLTIWSPNINIFRDPRWGRGQETYGEDPFLTSRFAVAFVRGLQGDDPHYLKTVATVKHYAVHSGPEPLRHQFDAVVSERDLHETYLPAFEAGIREGKAQSLMSAYNAIDGTPAPANHRLLTEILRDDWGFKGAVVGDVDTVGDMYNTRGHHFVPDAAQASALAIKAGNDLCSGDTYGALPEALKRGLITEKELDVALLRLLTLRLKLGQFDPQDRVPYSTIPISENASPAHDALALRASAESLVLLKNDGTLPWKDSDLHQVAVIGPCADDRAALVGNYCGQPVHPVTILAGLKAALGAKGIAVSYEPGSPLAQGYRLGVSDFPDSVVFSTPQCEMRGFQREVFRTGTFGGEADASVVDRQLNVHWTSFTPVPGIPLTGAAIRWSGVIVPPSTGDYVFCVITNGGVRLLVDGQTRIDSPGLATRRTLEATVHLETNQQRRIVLEFTQTAPSGEVRLGWRDPADAHREERALEAAKRADHIVMVLGLTPELEGEEMNVDADGFKGGDRTSIQLPAPQADLLAKVSALGKPVVLVLTTGSALAFDPAHANAVLVAWYYGQRGGDAVADALLGRASPAGRLPVTFYASDKDLPAFTDYAMANRTYRYFTGKPLYAFGFGLTYGKTAFTAVKASAASPAGVVSATVSLRNSGAVATDEVVELYAQAVHPPVPMPLRWLVGFTRVHLLPGEAKEVSLDLPLQRFRRWDEAGRTYVVDPGDYLLSAGPSSDNLPVLTTVSLR